MQVVRKGLLYLVVVLLSLAVFAPKRELYYLLESYLMRQDIIIDNETIESGLFSLTLRHPDLYVKGIRIATIQEVSLLTLLFYTHAAAKDIETDRSLRQWVPGKIDTVSLDYQLLDPARITIRATGFFGEAKGYLSLRKRVLHLDLLQEKAIGSLKPMLKKGKKGWYYETSF